MTDALLAELLYSTATATAKAAGFMLGSGADSQIRYVAETGAADILATTDAGADRDALIAEASSNFAKIVKTMIAEREQAYAGDAERLAAAIIGEDTLARAKARLCPIFPFC
jgi:hypothetical protein